MRSTPHHIVRLEAFPVSSLLMTGFPGFLASALVPRILARYA